MFFIDLNSFVFNCLCDEDTMEIIVAGKNEVASTDE